LSEDELEAEASSFAAKLDHLFKTVHPSGRGEYSFEEVATELARRGGPTISATYLWQLRKGVRDNPTKKHIEALSDFFGVPAAYFFDDEAAGRIDAELELLSTMRDAGVRGVALRSSGLSSESLDAVRAVIEQVRRLEGLGNGEKQEER
jgi:transcriptional regulator with XRE-family HTH domain